MPSGGGQRFGEYLRALRKDKDVTLREFCRRTHADPGNVSKMERGLLPPPDDLETLKAGMVEGFSHIGTDPVVFEGKRVLLKPNVRKAGPVEKAVVTHPEFFGAVLE